MSESETESNLMQVRYPNSNRGLPFKTLSNIGSFFLILLSVIPTTAAASSNSASTQEKYSDAMASYAALIEFEPMHGNVKNTLQLVKYLEDGKVTKKYFVSFAANGCVESIKWKNVYNGGSSVSLKKIKDKLISFQGTAEDEYYQLDSDCKIIKNIKTNEEYIYENNLISEIRKDGDVVKSFKFNSENELIEIAQSTPYKYLLKFDYLKNKNITTEISTSVLMADRSASEKVTCFDFDTNGNPSHCDLIRKTSLEDKIVNIKHLYKTNYY